MLSTLFVTLLVPIHVTSEDSLFYHTSINIGDDESGKNTVEIDSDEHVYTSIGDTLYKFDSQGEILHERTFSSEILATSLSPDYARLALTLRSNTNVDSVFILSTTDLNTLVSSEATAMNANLLAWSSNGASVFTNGPDEGLIQLNRETLEIDRTYSGNHTTNLVCFDVSNNAGNILTIDEDGLILLWDTSSEQVMLEFQLLTTIHDCQIDSEGEHFSVSTSENGIRKWTFDGQELKSIDINHAVAFGESNLANTIILQVTSPSPAIIVYDVINELNLQEIAMFHQFDDHALIYNEAGFIETIYTNSNAQHVVVYSSHIDRVGVGESGTDTDGDGIPDSLDNDDDGDGIEDNWDLNCQDIGISCELLPDEAFIRSIDLNVNATHLSMKQSFTLNKKNSADIRDLSRLSMDNDVRLIEAEGQLFADSVCANMDVMDANLLLSSILLVGNASLAFQEMYCSVENGMVLTPANDQVSHIRYSITTVYSLSSSQNLDELVIEVENHRFPASGSITELSEQHPIAISITGDSITTQRYVPWHIQEESISFALEVMQDDTNEISPKRLLNSPIFIGLLFASFIGVGIVVQQIYNRYTASEYDISVDEDDEDDDDDEDEQEWYEDVPEVEEDTSYSEPEDKTSTTPQRSATRQSRPRPKRVQVEKQEQSEAKKLLNDASKEVVRKRRARRTEDNPVRSKRRKLSDSQSNDVSTRKRRVVKKNADNDENMDETLKRFVNDSPEE